MAEREKKISGLPDMSQDIEQPAAPLLLGGSDEEYMEQEMKAMVRQALCERNELRGCGECRQCRTADSEVHPDVHWIRTDKKTISIKAIKVGLREISLTTTNSWRLMLIPQAERLTIPAANALLKSLEDSQAGVRMILSSKWPGRLLPTILSRCQRWQVKSQAGQIKVTSQLLGELKDLGTLERLALEPSVKAEDIEAMGWYLSEQLEEGGPSRELLAAMMRWRDYYRITASQGNEKLAKQMLLASLPKN